MPVLSSESLTHVSPQAVVEAVRRALESRGMAEPGWGELFAERLAIESSGRETWEYRGINPLPFVTVLWARDYAGRLSARIVAGTVHETEPIAERDEPPLAVLFPDHAYIVQRPGREREAMLACACGVIGGVESIAWMGDRCGPCHDRFEAGESVPGLRSRRQVSPEATELEYATLERYAWSKSLGTPLTLAPGGDLLLCHHERWWLNSPPTPVLALWTEGARNVTATWPTPAAVRFALYLDDGRLVLAAVDDDDPDLHLVVDSRPLLRLPLDDFGCWSMAADRDAIYLGGAGGILRVALADGTATPFPEPEAFELVHHLVCSPDRKTLALVDDAGIVALLDLASRELLALGETVPFEHHGGIAFTPDGEFLLVLSGSGKIYAYGLPELTYLGTIQPVVPVSCFKVEVGQGDLVLFDTDGLTSWPLEPLRELLGRWRSGRASG